MQQSTISHLNIFGKTKGRLNPSNYKNKIVGLFLSIGFFFLYFSLTSRVNFMQNDDSYYYSQVAGFLQGNFKLLPEIAPIFYLQGLLGSVFASVFGLERLPFLTLFTASANVFIFYLILTEIFEKRFFTSFIICGLFCFNPLFQYLLFGFMTEQYFLFFFLISLYFFYIYEKTGVAKNLFLTDLFIFAGFFLRQVSVVFAVSTSIFFLFKKRYKEALIQLGIFAALSLIYLIIPKSAEMENKTYQLHHLLDFKYIYAIFYGTFVYLSAFTLPVLLVISAEGFLSGDSVKEVLIKKIFSSISSTKSVFKRFFNLGDKNTVILKILFAVFLYIVLQIPFEPAAVSWGEFPYFENTWERAGFLPRDMHGTKYHFRGVYDLYLYWDILAKLLLSLFITVVVFSKNIRKKFFSLELIYIVFYLGLMFLTVTFYDRYIVIVVPVFLLWLVRLLKSDDSWLDKLFKEKKSRFLSFISFILQPSEIKKLLLLWLGGIVFVVFLFGYSYGFSSDFVFRQNYVWNRALNLAGTGGVTNTKIKATTAWTEKFGKVSRYAYIFSYDSPSVDKEKMESMVLIEEKRPSHVFNFFVNPAIYLYEKSW